MSDAARILDTHFLSPLYGCRNLREYLKKILTTLLREDEGFSGKRPLGNSGWQQELGNAMACVDLIPGACVDEDDIWFEWSEYEQVMARAIRGL
jgi:hypothetical protein